MALIPSDVRILSEKAHSKEFASLMNFDTRTCRFRRLGFNWAFCLWAGESRSPAIDPPPFPIHGRKEGLIIIRLYPPSLPFFRLLAQSLWSTLLFPLHPTRAISSTP
jgi:hypothetical protein